MKQRRSQEIEEGQESKKTKRPKSWRNPGKSRRIQEIVKPKNPHNTGGPRRNQESKNTKKPKKSRNSRKSRRKGSIRESKESILPQGIQEESRNPKNSRNQKSVEIQEDQEEAKPRR